MINPKDLSELTNLDVEELWSLGNIDNKTFKIFLRIGERTLGFAVPDIEAMNRLRVDYPLSKPEFHTFPAVEFTLEVPRKLYDLSYLRILPPLIHKEWEKASGYHEWIRERGL